MSILSDSRVKPFGADGHEVTTDQGVFRILPNDALGWGIYTGEHLNLVMTESGPAIGFESAEAAIKALLA
uniref:hypothetical protein n=1 Tax=Paractinoplanes polyasparticus TaxID=2856853 RepID=UPI001C858C63|nr:hypothetical protein [Actinoplanes polyasparticus]